MSGPTFSPDEKWMWNGPDWIPAPPKEQVLPKSAINETEVKSVATESGVDPDHLTQVAPYFDENEDRILQQTELQQAAMSIANVPNAPSPQPALNQQLAPSALMATAPMGGMITASGGKAPSALNWAALGLTAAAITLIFIAMFSNSWMTGEHNFNADFGLSEVEMYDDDKSQSIDYSDSECQDEGECVDIGDAGTTGLIFLSIAVVVAIGSLVLIGLNSFGVYQSKFGMISAFVSGGLTIIGIIIWLIMFPDWDEFYDHDLGAGFSFYLAMIGGLLGIAVGILEIFAGKSGGKSLNDHMQRMPQQQYNQQQQYGQPKQYQQ